MTKCTSCKTICDCEIPAKRHCTKYRGENLYIIVGELDGKLHELILNTCDQNKIEQQITLSGLDLVAGLITEMLHNNMHENVYNVLKRTSRSRNDLAGKIKEVLELK